MSKAKNMSISEIDKRIAELQAQRSATEAADAEAAATLADAASTAKAISEAATETEAAALLAALVDRFPKLGRRTRKADADGSTTKKRTEIAYDYSKAIMRTEIASGFAWTCKVGGATGDPRRRIEQERIGFNPDLRGRSVRLTFSPVQADAVFPVGTASTKVADSIFRCSAAILVDSKKPIRCLVGLGLSEAVRVVASETMAGWLAGVSAKPHLEIGGSTVATTIYDPATVGVRITNVDGSIRTIRASEYKPKPEDAATE